jgi:flagellar basal body-associated protein FliL
LALIFIFGTIYGVFFHSISPENHQADNSQQNGEGQIFTGLGTLRVPTTDLPPGMVIIFVSFLYYPDDKTFSEELVLRIADFRDIITGYIGSFSIIELQQLSEESKKSELLRRFNAILRLGKIEGLFFSEFMIIG